MRTKIEVRFAIGTPNGPRSSFWRVWSWGDDVYAATRSVAHIEKISFHASGFCRRAFTQERGTPATLTDRATIKWKRIPTPQRGEGRASLVFALTVPTDFLSTCIPPTSKPTEWITAAPAKHATIIEMFFTNETNASVVRDFASFGERVLVRYDELPNGQSFAIATRSSRCENRELRVPASHHEQRDLLFSSEDPEDTGRPIRITMYEHPNDGDALIACELGGYYVNPEYRAGEALATLARGSIWDKSGAAAGTGGS
jgi:hypothetical protein